VPHYYARYNYVTHRYERRKLPSTDEEALQYIPQNEYAQSFYAIRRKQGDSVLQAITNTLDMALDEFKDTRR